jgi:23S rRNA (cytidine1920-2'-O)/16S rRNA (cytidine1409-2'-O)-methyltransferase
MRLDRALQARGLARSRTHAQSLITAGAVTVNDVVVTRASAQVDDPEVIVVNDDGYVSRAAHKLLSALDACSPQGLTVAGRRALDAGASTGGFTQVLLERGAAHVTAIDVGHGQLAAQIATDPRVTAIEGLNVRDLTPAHLPGAIDLVVADLSFISLTLVTRPLICALASGDLLLMVKPQFEVGKERLGAGGVVTSPDDRARAVAGVAEALLAEGAVIHTVEKSGLPGLTGNVEFFVWGSVAWNAKEGGRDERPQLSGADLALAIETVTKGRL